MGKTGFIGEVAEMLQEEAEKGLTTAKQQITDKNPSQPSNQAAQPQANQKSSQTTQQAPAADQAGGVPSETATTNQPQDDQTQKFVQDLYGGDRSNVSEAEIKKKELEDKQKREELRQKLHSEYYERLVNPQKPKEERSAEKVEREEEEKKQMALQEEEKKKKEALPLITTKNMGTAEKLRGVSG